MKKKKFFPQLMEHKNTTAFYFKIQMHKGWALKKSLIKLLLCHICIINPIYFTIKTYIIHHLQLKYTRVTNVLGQ